MTPETLLSVRGLTKTFSVSSPLSLRNDRRTIYALNGVDLDVQTGEIVALVGETGSGKTTLANTIAGFTDPTAGSITLGGTPLVEVRRRLGRTRVARALSRRELAMRIQMIFQDPSTALNPRQSVRSAITEPLVAHGLPKREAQTRVEELCEMTGVPSQALSAYPANLNTGMRQRVVLARALTVNPTVLLADEPVSSLDVSVQGQILNLLLDLKQYLNVTILIITHDLSVVRQVADRVVVMYLGRIMETAPADDFFHQPVHPYSEALLASTPRLAGAPPTSVLQGEIPSVLTALKGCPFLSRCPLKIPECGLSVPPLAQIADEHSAACIRRTATLPIQAHPTHE